MSLFDVLKTLIIYGITAIILLSLAWAVYKWLFAVSIEEQCRLSLLKADALAIAGKPFGAPECKMSRRVYSAKEFKDSEALKAELAGQLISCWRMFGEGKLVKAFEAGWIFKQMSCLLCARLEFERELAKKFDRLEGFADYLRDTKIPDREISYEEYLSAPLVLAERVAPFFFSKKLGEAVEPYLLQDIDLSKSYYIVLLATRQPFFRGKRGNQTIVLIAEENYGKLGCDSQLN